MPITGVADWFHCTPAAGFHCDENCPWTGAPAPAYLTCPWARPAPCRTGPVKGAACLETPPRYWVFPTNVCPF